MIDWCSNGRACVRNKQNRKNWVGRPFCCNSLVTKDRQKLGSDCVNNRVRGSSITIAIHNVFDLVMGPSPDIGHLAITVSHIIK